jgi:hypothetical protein
MSVSDLAVLDTNVLVYAELTPKKETARSGKMIGIL